LNSKGIPEIKLLEGMERETPPLRGKTFNHIRLWWASGIRLMALDL